MTKPSPNDLITNILVVIICFVCLISCSTSILLLREIDNLRADLVNQRATFDKRHLYLNRRIDLADLAARDANILAESAWTIADKKRTDKWHWIEGLTTDEISLVWKQHVENGAPLP